VNNKEDFSSVPIMRMSDYVGFEAEFSKHMKDKEGGKGTFITRRGSNFLIGENAAGFDRIRFGLGYTDCDFFNKDYIQSINISFNAHGNSVETELFQTMYLGLDWYAWKDENMFGGRNELHLLTTCGEQLESFCQIAAKDNRALVRIICVTEDEIDLEKEWIEPPPYVEPPKPVRPKTPEDPREKMVAKELFESHFEEQQEFFSRWDPRASKFMMPWIQKFHQKNP